MTNILLSWSACRPLSVEIICSAYMPMRCHVFEGITTPSMKSKSESRHAIRRERNKFRDLLRGSVRTTTMEHGARHESRSNPITVLAVCPASERFPLFHFFCVRDAIPLFYTYLKAARVYAAEARSVCSNALYGTKNVSNRAKLVDHQLR